jgi:hypothetical protein
MPVSLERVRLVLRKAKAKALALRLMSRIRSKASADAVLEKEGWAEPPFFVAWADGREDWLHSAGLPLPEDW